MVEIEIRKISSLDQNWIKELFQKEWFSDKVISQGRIYQYKNLQGFIAVYQNKRVGLITYTIKNEKILEIISINSLKKNIGIGTEFVNHITKFAKSRQIDKIEVVTTNDNLKALKFYQKCGFKIMTVNVNIMREYRKIKPEIPLKAENGILIRDEFILQKKLNH